MANNPVVNSITFAGSVAGQASIQAQGIAGGLTLLLPNTTPNVLQLLEVQAINGNNVFLGWVSPQSSSVSLSQITQSGATPGQVIEWSGSAWVPASAGGFGAQTANFVFAGPVSGAAATPTFRALVQADIGANTVSLAAINSKEGTGSKVQLTNAGVTVSGDVVTYDGAGNVQDSGTLLSSLAPKASPTFTGLVTLPVAASTTGLTMLSDNNQINSTNAPIVLSSATATNPQVITITPNSFFGPQIQFSGQNTPYTVGRLTEVGAQGLYLSNAGFAINGNLGTSGQLLTTLGAAGDGGPAGLAWINQSSLPFAPTANPTFTGTVVLPSAVHATGGSDLIFTATAGNKIRIATATGVFDFFGTGGGMTLGSQNSQIAIDASGNISLSATGGSNLSVNSAGGLVTSSDFKPTNLFSFPGNSSGSAGQVFTSLGGDTGTAWVSQSGTGGNTIASAKTNLTAATAGNIVTADGSGNVQDGGVSIANVPLKVSVVLSSAQLLALGTTPVQIVPAPGVGKYANLLYGVASYHFGTTPYTGAGSSTHFFILNSANQPNVATAYGMQSGFIDALGTSTSSVIQMGSSFGFSATAADLDNQPFTISFDTASNILTLGDGTVTITVYYTIEASAA